MKLHHILFAILVAALWGFNFIAVKVGLLEMPPFLYCAARFCISCLPILCFVKKPSVSWMLIFGIGVTLGVIKFGFMFMGLHMGMSAGLASLVLQSQALFTTVLSAFFLNDNVRTNQIIGMIIAFLGIAFIGITLHESSPLISFLLIIGAAISWAFCNILVKLAGKVNMFSLVVWTSLIPPIPMYVLSFIYEGPGALPQMLSHMSLLGWSCLIFTAVGSTWIGSTLWGILLRTYDASLVVPYSLLIPIFGISFGHVLLNEQFTPFAYLSCGLIFVGLIINQWKVRKIIIQSQEIANPPQAKEKVA
ncbi:MAG: EamA family transporter [Alphaproteobacteria bacterium]|nr:EamA family transporter [Alphaproteobacteria bacterium]